MAALRRSWRVTGVLQRMSAPTGKTSLFPTDTWPTEAFYTDAKRIRMNDEPIVVEYQKAAHSGADSFVFFRISDVVAAGEVLDTTRFPVIDVANGGSIQGEVERAGNHLIDLAVPPRALHLCRAREPARFPAHHCLCVQLDVVNYRDMVVNWFAT